MDDTKNNGRIRQRNYRNMKQMNELLMVEDISDDKSYGMSIEDPIRKNNEIIESAIMDD